jgi:hypothetical protein
MTKYAEIYNKATLEMLHMAKQIDKSVQSKIQMEYRLQDIVYVLRELYKSPIFRQEFVGNVFGPDKWSKGMCFYASYAIYELYGGSDVWNFYKIPLEAWGKSSVTFLRDKFQNIAFGTTGEHFYPDVIPYDLGTPLANFHITPKNQHFITIVKDVLDRI